MYNRPDRHNRGPCVVSDRVVYRTLLHGGMERYEEVEKALKSGTTRGRLSRACVETHCAFSAHASGTNEPVVHSLETMPATIVPFDVTSKKSFVKLPFKEPSLPSSPERFVKLGKTFAWPMISTSSVQGDWISETKSN